MANNVDPVIVVKLAEFRQRLRKLWLIRVICAGAITLFVASVLVAILDWLFLMPDWLRWALAALLYAGTVVVVWQNGHNLFARLDDRELARRIESLRPELRERLLAAVELGKSQDTQTDSSAFRQLIQKQVAAQLRDFEINSLLPESLVKPLLRLTLILAAISCALFLLPHTPFRLLITRALLPGANLARLSETEIEILAPAPPEAVVPRGDSVPIVASLSGKPARHAAVEFRNAAGGWERLNMTPMKPGQFSASLSISSDPIEYRLVAGDARTRRYRLTPKPRPHVVRFEKIYRYPRYARLDPIKTSDDNGDIIGIEDSEVELRLQLDQPVSKAELEIVSGRNSTNAVPLTESINGMLQARIALTGRQTYRVRLISQETGFENRFSPQYEIRPIPDLPPVVQISGPDQDIVAAPDDWIMVQGKATDDLPLAAVNQWVQKNSDAWKEVSLSNIAKTNVSLQTKWDLIDFNLTAGDHVQTKFSATDLKGARTESPPIQVTIISSTLDGKRMRVVQEHRRIAMALNQLRTSTESVASSFDEAAQNLQIDDLGLQGRQIALKLASQTAGLSLRIGEALDLIKATLPNSRSGAESAALGIVGNALIAAHGNGLEVIEPALINAALPSESALRIGARALRETGPTWNWYREIVLAEEVGAAVEGLLSLIEEQQRLLAQCARNQPEMKEQLKRRETAATRSVVLIEQVLTNVSSAIPDQLAKQLWNSEEQIAAERAAFQSKLQETGFVGTNQIETYRVTLEHALYDSLALSKELSSKLPGAPFPGLELHLQIKNRPLGICAKIIDGFADLEELRPEGHLWYTAELGNLGMALHSRISAGTSSYNADDFTPSLMDGLSLLRFERTLNELIGNLENLEQAEKWELQEIKNRTERPRNWEWSKRVLQSMPLSFAGISSRASKLLEESAASSALREIQDEMDRRFDLSHPAKSVAPGLGVLLAVLKQSGSELSTNLASIRAGLIQETPDLSIRMQRLAERSEELQAATRRAASNNLPDVKLSRKLYQIQQTLNIEIDRVCTVIRRDANLEDIVTKTGRDKARDSDDALALLSRPTALAEDALREAISARSANERTRRLEFAVAQQNELSRVLRRLDEHFQNVRAGAPENTRSGLRQDEEDLGVKFELDQIYSKVNLFIEGSQSAENLMAELERELTNSASMRQELRSISKHILSGLESLILEAASAEASIFRQLNDLSKRLASQREALTVKAGVYSDELKQIATVELLRLSQDAKGEHISTAAEIDSIAKMLKEAADQGKIEIGQAPSEGASQLETAARVIDNAADRLRGTEKESAVASATARLSEQELLARSEESREALQDSKTQVQALELEVSRLRARQEQHNTEELQHLFEHLETEYAAAENQAKSAMSFAEIAAKNARMAREASTRIEKMDQDLQKVTERTTRLASDIQNLGEALKKVAQDAGTELSRSVIAEQPISRQVEIVITNLSRAVQHAGRLAISSSPEEKQQSTDLNEKLKSVVLSTQQLVSKDIPAAQQSIQHATFSGSAWPEVERVEKRLRDVAIHLSELSALLSPLEISRLKRDRESGQRSETESKWLARALDQLEAARNGPESSPQAILEVEKAMRAAIQCNRTSMSLRRAVAANTRNQMKSISDRKDLTARESEKNPAFPPAADSRDRDWGILPRKIAEDLFQASRDPVSPEYQAMVDSYFKAIAEKAKQGMP